MALDLDWLKELATSYGFSATGTHAELDVELPDGLQLVFSNADDDEMIGLRGGEWHFHPPWLVEVGDGLVREFTADAVLEAVASRDVMVVEIYESGVLTDRWLEHREGTVDLKYTQSDEELRVRVAGGTATSPAQ